LAAVLVLALPGHGWAQFTYTIDNGAITITGYTGPDGMVTIPSTIDGYPVAAIGANAFADQYTISGVTIPNSVTSIGMNAFFYCDSLTSVTFGNSVAGIGDGAFQNCTSLSSVTLPDSLTSIGNAAFDRCYGLTSVTLGNSVSNIGEQAFYECYVLESVTIPSSVTSIGQDAFSYCPGLTNIVVNAANPSYASADGVLFNKTMTTLIQCPAGLAGSYAIPDSVTNIGNDAFYDCYLLTNVTMGNSVNSIGDSAFALSYGLTSMTLPDSVTSIGNDAFDQCSGLTNVTIGNSVANIGTHAFVQCYSLTSMTIPNSVTSIGDHAFSYCRHLTNIAVNAGNPDYASSGGVLFDKPMTTLIQCPQGLAGSYAIPNIVTTIADGAFSGSSGLTPGLTNVTIGRSVTSIGNSAFSGSYGLTSMTIPESVTNIGNYAFSGCKGLHQVYFQGDAPSVNGGAGSADSTVFQGESGTAYFLPDTTGWGATFGGWPTAAGSYQPQPQIIGPGYGMGAQSNGFQFTISWATNAAVVVEASTNLLAWTSVITNTLVNSSNAFSDSTWTNYPRRFYRVRSQ
jgi:hypothetical protein